MVDKVRVVKVGDKVEIGGNKRFALIAGPCVIESEELVMEVAGKIKDICDRLGIQYIFKASFDKANRSSIHSFRGPGLEKGLEILKKVKEKYNVPVITDVHETWQCKKAAEVVDILQIPAFLCRQTDLLLAAAETGLPVNIKKGQFLAPWDMKNVVTKMEESNNQNILLCERGSTFGYNNMVVDMRSFMEMRKFGYPVVFDVTHAVQRPGGLGTATSGDREYVFPLMRAGLAIGVDAIFAEVHPNPNEAKSDGPNMLFLDDLEEILKVAIKIDDLVKGRKVIVMEFPEVDYARSVFEAEIEELGRVKNSLDGDITKVVELILGMKGKVVVTGIGKSGLIGKKIAATLASTGTTAIFMNSAEGLHGDLGMIAPNDVVLAIQPVEHLHQHRREHHTATVFAAGLLKRIRQAAALRSGQFTGGSFNSDEWCEAPRLINRLDAAPVVLYRGQPVAVPAVPGHLRFP